MWRFMRSCDLVLTPTIAVPPFPTGLEVPETVEGRPAGPLDTLAFTFPLNMTGQPAASVPHKGLRQGRQLKPAASCSTPPARP